MSILAIDQGTTSTRGLLVDAAGRVEPVFSRAHRQIYPGPGRVEHDPEELLANVAACLEAPRPDGIAAVALANQGESCLAWDAATGEAVSPVVVWQDARTAGRLEALREHEAFVLERAGLPLDPYFSASKLGWIVEEIPRARELAKTGRLRLGTTDAFFRDRLTGRFETDIATASRTSLIDIGTGDWDADLCALFGIPIEALPPIGACSGDLGLVAGLPLAASIVDQQAALFGHGCRVAGDAKITFGTGAFVLALTGPALRRTRGGTLPTIAWREAGAGTVHALDGGVYTASAALEWARGLGLFQSFAEIASFDRPSALSRGLAFVPALAGLAAPHWDRAARGAWLGLSLNTDRRDLVQALLEGIAYRTAEVLEAMAREIPLANPIPIDGGMSANGAFCQMVADILGRPIRVSGEAELTALGAASMAARAIGRPIDAPARGRVVEPDPEAKVDREAFARAREAVQGFAPRQGTEAEGLRSSR